MRAEQRLNSVSSKLIGTSLRVGNWGREAGDIYE